MTCKGEIHNGVVVMEDPQAFPEGTEVVVLPAEVRKPFFPHFKTAEEEEEYFRTAPSCFEVFKEFIGAFEGPEDLALNHDHYLHGAPKKGEEE